VFLLKTALLSPIKYFPLPKFLASPPGFPSYSAVLPAWYSTLPQDGAADHLVGLLVLLSPPGRLLKAHLPLSREAPAGANQGSVCTRTRRRVCFRDRGTARWLDQTRPAPGLLSNSPALTFTTFIYDHTINLETHIHHGSGDFPLLFTIAPCREPFCTKCRICIHVHLYFIFAHSKTGINYS
jgi:hypothetical protein